MAYVNGQKDLPLCHPCLLVNTVHAVISAPNPPLQGRVARRDPFNDGLVPLLRLLSTGLSILIAMAATGVTLVGFGAVALTWGAIGLRSTQMLEHPCGCFPPIEYAWAHFPSLLAGLGLPHHCLTV